MFPITNDAVVLGLLLCLLALIFKASTMNYFKKFFMFVPSLLLCYFIPSIFNSLGIISANESKLYFMASRYLLPASLVLLCLSIDLKSTLKLGPKALIMFFSATIGIVLGGPIALWIVSIFDHSVLDGDIWKGLSTVAGSWIGGGANQTAMKEIYGASDQIFSAMIVVDVFVANIFMSILLFGAGNNQRINSFLKADDSSINELQQQVEEFQKKSSKIPTTNELFYLAGITFFVVGLSHLFADLISPVISEYLEKLSIHSPMTTSIFSSFGSDFFWLVILSTIFGVALSFTKARNFEGIGASKFGSVFLYILVATIGMKMDIGELISNWQDFKSLIVIGLIWISIHGLIVFSVAKLIRAPFFFLAVGSQANVGGAASAPVVASAFNPSLAPVGVLLAVLGYALGTFGAIFCTILMRAIVEMG